MLQNYQYFLTLAETLNISQAAKQLFISHQCLSRYLKTLESECGLMLFERKPSLSLTYAGETLLAAFRQIQRIEQDTLSQLEEIQDGTSGEVRIGITEGRLRIFFPRLLESYQPLFPNVTLRVTSAPTAQMLDRLLENKLDLVLGSPTGQFNPALDYSAVLNETLYLVISDRLLRQYFPADYPACKEEMTARGVDLSHFRSVPFCVLYRGFNSRTIIEEHLRERNLSLNFIYEASQPDLLHIMTSHDYAASFCLSMYLENIRNLNQARPPDNQLHAFPIQDLHASNPIFLISQKGRHFPRYTSELIKLIRQQCFSYRNAGGRP